MKGKIKKFFTLDVHNHSGFTLVELIVVIAILAILAGVGTAGYAGYIKSANKKADVTNAKNVIRAIQTAGNSYSHGLSSEQASSVGLQIPVGFVILSNETIVDSDGNDQGYVYFLTAGDNATANQEEMNKILTNAFGSSYDGDLMLLSDIWTDTNISSMTANATSLYDKMKTFSDLLATSTIVEGINATLKMLGKSYTFTKYDTGADAVNHVAERVLSKYKTEDEFVTVWVEADGKNNKDYGFGFSQSNDGIETYTAIRTAYNEALASYIEKKASGSHTTTKYTFSNGTDLTGYSNVKEETTTDSCADHTKEIRKFAEHSYESKVMNVSLYVSDLVVSALFGKSGSDQHGYTTTTTSFWGNTKTQYNKTAGQLPDNVQLCETCTNLVKSYSTSSEAKQDARMFYQLMQTFYNTKDAAKDTAAQKGNDCWTYYNTFVSNYSDLYTNVKTITGGKSCIVITVYLDSVTGLLTTECNTPGVVDD